MEGKKNRDKGRERERGGGREERGREGEWEVGGSREIKECTNIHEVNNLLDLCTHLADSECAYGVVRQLLDFDDSDNKVSHVHTTNFRPILMTLYLITQ